MGLAVRILSLLCVLGSCILEATLSPALAEKRIALVIGNNIYRNLSDREQLKNAVNDAEAVKAALELLHFQVDLGENLDRAALIGKLSDFGARLEQGDLALHGWVYHIGSGAVMAYDQESGQFKSPAGARPVAAT